MFCCYNIILLAVLLSTTNGCLSRRIPPYIKQNTSIFHEKTIYMEDTPPINIWVPYSWNDAFYKIVELAKTRIHNYRNRVNGYPHNIQLTMPKLFVDDMNNIFMLFA